MYYKEQILALLDDVKSAFVGPSPKLKAVESIMRHAADNAEPHPGLEPGVYWRVYDDGRVLYYVDDSGTAYNNIYEGPTGVISPVDPKSTLETWLKVDEP